MTDYYENRLIRLENAMMFLLIRDGFADLVSPPGLVLENAGQEWLKIRRDNRQDSQTGKVYSGFKKQQANSGSPKLAEYYQDKEQLKELLDVVCTILDVDKQQLPESWEATRQILSQGLSAMKQMTKAVPTDYDSLKVTNQYIAEQLNRIFSAAGFSAQDISDVGSEKVTEFTCRSLENAELNRRKLDAIKAQL